MSNRPPSLLYQILIAILIFLTPGISLAEPSPFKVGVSLPLTGPLAPVGESFKNGIILRDKISDPENSVEFIFEDDQYQPKLTSTIIKKFIAVDKIQALVVLGSGTSLAVALIAEQHKLPFLSLSSSPEVIAGKSYIVKHWLDPEVESKLAYEKLQDLESQSLVLVTSENDAMEALRQAFLERKPKNILLDEHVSPGDTDLRSLAFRITRAKPAAVYLIMTPPHPGLLARRLKELNYKGTILAAHPVDIDPVLRDPKGPLLNAWYITADDRPAEHFHQDYLKHFKKEPLAGAANGYDIAKLIIEGIKTPDLNTYLHNVKDFKGAFGIYGSNGKNGFNVPAAVRQMTVNGVIYADGDNTLKELLPE